MEWIAAMRWRKPLIVMMRPSPGGPLMVGGLEITILPAGIEYGIIRHYGNSA